MQLEIPNRIAYTAVLRTSIKSIVQIIRQALLLKISHFIISSISTVLLNGVSNLVF